MAHHRLRFRRFVASACAAAPLVLAGACGGRTTLSFEVWSGPDETTEDTGADGSAPPDGAGPDGARVDAGADGDASTDASRDVYDDGVPRPPPVEIHCPNGRAASVATSLRVLGIRDQHTCAVRTDGTLCCWGDANGGGIGNGDTYTDDGRDTDVNYPYPEYVVTSFAGQHLTGVASVATGASFSCALKTDGTVVCFGIGGTLGTGSMAGSGFPVTVPGITDAVAVATGHMHACALLRSGQVRCWGDDTYGEIGTGTSAYFVLSPFTVPGISGASAISLGDAHSCALIGGQVRCWGSNVSGQVGSGTMGDIQYVPVTVAGLADATAIGAGEDHTCALRASGSVVCWGAIAAGRGVYALSPQAVPQLDDATAIAAGAFHTCAVRRDSTVVCWGSNTDIRSATGVLGDGMTERYSLVPVPAVGLTGVASLSAGQAQTCALLTDGRVACWGTVPYLATVGPANVPSLVVAFR